MSERLSWSEAESVVRAYRAERGASADVDMSTLAQALGTDVAEVRRLAGRKPRFVDRSGALSAGLAFALVALGAAAVGPTLYERLLPASCKVAALPKAAPYGALIITTNPDGRVYAHYGDGKTTDPSGSLWTDGDLRIDTQDENEKL